MLATTVRSTALAVALAASAPAALGVELEAKLSGHFDDTGSFIADETTSENYSTGFVLDALTSTLFVRRSYFVFDLTSVTTPVVDALLILPQAAPPVPLYVSPNPSEFFIVTDVPFTEAELRDPSLYTDPITTETGPGAIFGTLGTGTLLGDTEVFAPLPPPDGPEAEIFLPLGSPEAIDYINANLGGTLILGARMFGDEVLPPDFARILFSGTNPGIPPGTFDEPTPKVTLELIIPEPAGPAILLLALAGLARRRA
ncbi:MAG: hypothetical protein AAF078_10830 [Planctomycetota bacterium]